MLATLLHAQPVITPDLLGQGEQQQRRQQEREDAQRQQLQATPDVRLPATPPPAPSRLKEGETPCFVIREVLIRVSGNKSSPEPSGREPGDASRLASGLDHALAGIDGSDSPTGRCLGTEAIQTVAGRVQAEVIAKGFVTTRVLVEPQDLSGGTLRLTILPGRIRSIRFAVNEGHRGQVWNALPASPGDLLTRCAAGKADGDPAKPALLEQEARGKLNTAEITALNNTGLFTYTDADLRLDRLNAIDAKGLSALNSSELDSKNRELSACRTVSSCEKGVIARYDKLTSDRTETVLTSVNVMKAYDQCAGDTACQASSLVQMQSLLVDLKTTGATADNIDRIGLTARIAAAQSTLGLGADFMNSAGAAVIGASASNAGNNVASTGPGHVKASEFGDTQKLNDHFTRHGTDFGASSPQEYQMQAEKFLTSAKTAETLEKNRPNGDILRYNPKTDEFGVISAAGTIRTYYKPDPLTHGRPSNLDYFNAQ